MTNSKELPAPGGEADGAYYNVWLTIPKVAAGVMTNQARAKLSYGGWLEPGEPIVFTIMSGSAVFAGGLKTTTVTTDSFGCAFAAFSDVGSDAGEIKAAMQDNTDVSDKAPYSFGGGASSGFNIALSAVVDDAPADGTSDDQGRALVTYGGGPLQDRQNVQFVFGAGSSAVFETDKPDVQAGSTDAKLIVKTHLDEQGNDIADAYFHDASGEQVTLIATLVDHPEAAAGTMGFTFTAAPPGFEIGLNRVADDAPADGVSDDQGRAVVTENGGPLQAPKIVKFTFASGASARFDTSKPAGYVQPNSSATVLYVKTHFDNDAQKDIADAYFTDNEVETVALTAGVDGEPQTKPKTQSFQFSAPLTYFLGLTSMTPDGVPADGITENLGRAIVSCDGSGLPGPQTVKFVLQGGGTFDTRGADVLPGSGGSTLFLKTHNDGRQDVAYAYFTASGAGSATLQASLPDHPTVQGCSTDFRFSSPPWPYAIALTSLTLDGVPADGKAENHAQVVVTYGGKPMGPTQVVFELIGAWGAKFDANKPYVYSSSATTITVSTHTDEQGRDIADAYFTGTAAGTVTLTATFPEYIRQGASPAWRYFFFSTSGDASS
jgi:hypothetical protein